MARAGITITKALLHSFQGNCLCGLSHSSGRTTHASAAHVIQTSLLKLPTSAWVAILILDCLCLSSSVI